MVERSPVLAGLALVTLLASCGGVKPTDLKPSCSDKQSSQCSNSTPLEQVLTCDGRVVSMETARKELEAIDQGSTKNMSDWQVGDATRALCDTSVNKPLSDQTTRNSVVKVNPDEKAQTCQGSVAWKDIDFRVPQGPWDHSQGEIDAYNEVACPK